MGKRGRHGGAWCETDQDGGCGVGGGGCSGRGWATKGPQGRRAAAAGGVQAAPAVDLPTRPAQHGATEGLRGAQPAHQQGDVPQAISWDSVPVARCLGNPPGPAQNLLFWRWSTSPFPILNAAPPTNTQAFQGVDMAMLGQAVQRLLEKSRLVLVNHPKGGRCLRFISEEQAASQVERCVLPRPCGPLALSPALEQGRSKAPEKFLPLARSQSGWPRQFGEPGPFSAPTSAEVYRKPSMST